MKHFKVFSMVLVLLTVSTMTSCLNSDNDNNDEEIAKRQAQLKTEMAASKGSYSGYLYRTTNDAKNPLDSTVVTWRIVNDSTMLMYDVPVSYLASHVSDSTLRARLSAAGTVDMKIKIYYYAAISPLVFCVAPEDVDVTAVDDSGVAPELTQAQATFRFYNTGEVSYDYYSGYQDSYGAYSMTSRESMLRIYPKDIYVGYSMAQRFDANAELLWFGKQQ